MLWISSCFLNLLDDGINFDVEAMNLHHHFTIDVYVILSRAWIFCIISDANDLCLSNMTGRLKVSISIFLVNDVWGLKCKSKTILLMNL